MNQKLPWFAVRRRQLWMGLLMALPVAIVLSGLLAYGGHHARIWLAGGVWCVDALPNGELVSYYGDLCKGPLQP